MKERPDFVPENDEDMYEDDVTLEDVQKRMADLFKILWSPLASTRDKQKASKRMDDLLDRYIEFLD